MFRLTETSRADSGVPNRCANPRRSSNDSAYAASAAAQSPRACATWPTLFRLTETSRADSGVPNRCANPRRSSNDSAYAASAAAQSPRACATWPTLFRLTETSRADSGVPNRCANPRASSNDSAYAASAAAQSPRACATWPTLSRLTETSRADSGVPNRCANPRRSSNDSAYAASAAAQSPRACATWPTLFRLTETSRADSGVPNRCANPRRSSNDSAYAASAAAQSPRASRDLAHVVQADRDIPRRLRGAQPLRQPPRQLQRLRIRRLRRRPVPKALGHRTAQRQQADADLRWCACLQRGSKQLMRVRPVLVLHGELAGRVPDRCPDGAGFASRQFRCLVEQAVARHDLTTLRGAERRADQLQDIAGARPAGVLWDEQGDGLGRPGRARLRPLGFRW